MNIVCYEVTATMNVAVNTASPDAALLSTQLKAALSAAVQAWQDKVRGAAMVDGVTVTVNAGQAMVAAPVVAAPSPAAPSPTTSTNTSTAAST